MKGKALEKRAKSVSKEGPIKGYTISDKVVKKAACNLTYTPNSDLLVRMKNHGVRVIVVDSPKYLGKADNNESSIRMREICDSLDVTIIDNSAMEGLSENIEMFNDYTHMNEKGAELYTRKFLEQIKCFHKKCVE